MTIRSTRLGRFQVPEPPSSLKTMHLYRGAPLTTSTHLPPVGVLDQEDLLAQGIHTSVVVPGAPDVTALGSCTANAAMAALSGVLDQADYLDYTGATSYDDVVHVEEQAIRFYHACTDQTGTPGQEWPPTDCGSSGLYVVDELVAQKVISEGVIAHGATNLVSLLQTGPVIEGTPFFNSWETVDPAGFVDGNGTHAALEEAIKSGIAGGHETCIFGVETLKLAETGAVTPLGTILVVRNSWSKSWGDAGNFRIHLSTLVALGGQCDFRQLVA